MVVTGAPPAWADDTDQRSALETTASLPVATPGQRTMLEANDILRSRGVRIRYQRRGSLDTATVLQRIKQLFTQSHQDGRPPLLVVDEGRRT